MFRKEIKFIYDFNLNKVRKLGAYLTYEQIRKADIHPAILHYISAEIDYLIFEDRQKILKDSIFDYSGEQISDYFNKIGGEVKKNKRFSIEYIAQLILHSSSFTVNYLARPRWALMKLIFEDDEHKSTTEIKQILNYVFYYGYLKKIITSYINRKKILSLNYNEFEDLLNKIDDLGFQSDFNVLLESALHSMSDFFNMGESNKHLIPLQCVELFVREKNLQSHLVKLRDAFPQDDKLVFDLSDYKKVFGSIRLDQTEEFEKIDPDTVEEGSAPESDSEFIEEEIKIAPLGEDDDSLKIKIDKKDELIEKEFDELQKFGVSNDSGEEEIAAPESEISPLPIVENDIQETEQNAVDDSEISLNEPVTETLEDEDIVPKDSEVETPMAESVQPEDSIIESPSEEEVDIPSDDAVDDLNEQPQSVIDEHVEEAQHVEGNADTQTENPDEMPAETGDVKQETSEEVVEMDMHEIEVKEETEEFILEEVDEKEDELVLVEEETPNDEVSDEEPAEPETVEKDEIIKTDDIDEPIKDDFIDSLKFDEEAESLIYDPVYEEKKKEDEPDSEQLPEVPAESKSGDVENDGDISPEIQAEQNEEVMKDDLSLFESMDKIENNSDQNKTKAPKTEIASEMFGATPDDSDISEIGEGDPKDDEIIPVKSKTDAETPGSNTAEENTEEENDPDNGVKKIEVSELLERKNMTRVIEIIFDYDIEEFAYIIDKTCSSENEREAMKVLSKLFKNNRVSATSKEAETLKSIISDFFSRKEE